MTAKSEQMRIAGEKPDNHKSFIEGKKLLELIPLTQVN
jgi:hypothetical protein